MNLMITNSQQMHMSFTKCNHVSASNLKVIAPAVSPNTDGIHISASTRVMVKDSVIATGMAVGRDLLGKTNHVISVIGDGAMTAGQAYEAMNNAGYLDSNLIIVLNDNKQVPLPTASVDGAAPPVEALSRALTRLQSSRKLRQLREAAKGLTKQIGGKTHEVAAKVDEYARGMVSGSGASLFEELGLYYIGPVDGHSVEDLVHIFEKVKAMPVPGPVLIHIITEKGKGYPLLKLPPIKCMVLLNSIRKPVNKSRPRLPLFHTPSTLPSL